MKYWKRPLTESFLLGFSLALAVIFIARQQMYTVLEWIGPVFYIPAHGSMLLSGNAHEPPAWLYHTILILQFCLASFIVGWLLGRYRTKSQAA